MYKCEICGRKTKHRNHIDGKQVCPKHYNQFKRHGKFLDNNPRTTKDLNDYRIEGDVTIFNIYDKNCIKICEFIIDTEDLDKVKYRKWRIDKYGYIVSGNVGQKNKLVRLQRLILPPMNENNYIDHINNNKLDNRKCNLRECSSAENNFNKIDSGRNTSGIMGVFWDKDRNKWAPEIRANSSRIHLGRWNLIEEAAIARMYAEKLLFKEFQNYTHNIEDYTSKLSDKRVKEIYNYIESKLKSKNIV